MTSLEAVLAARLHDAATVTAGAITARIREDLPSLFVVPGHEELARTGVEALMREFEAVLRFGQRDGFHAPTAAVAFARDHARRGTPLADVLRSYQVGQQATFDLVASAAAAIDAPAEDRADALARVGRLSFSFADAVMADVAHAFEEERERRIGRAIVRREALVADLLAGRAVDRAAAEAALGYRLDGEHHALVLVGGAVDGDLATLLRRLGGGRPLVTGSGAWLRVDPARPLDLDALARELGSAGLRVALGGPTEFARAHEQAQVAATVARLRPAPALVVYAEVAVGALLLRDRAAAQAFAAERLGPIVDEPLLCATLRAWLDGGQDHSAAAVALAVHRNTVRRRLARAEALLGAPLPSQARDLDAALLIRELTGPRPA